MTDPSTSTSTPQPTNAEKITNFKSYTLHSSTYPTPAEYLHLRTITDLTPPPLSHSKIEQGLRTSLHCIVARTTTSTTTTESTFSTSPNTNTNTNTDPSHPNQKTIGMLRLIGDGQIFCHLVDMGVDPAYQRQGIGGAILDLMLEWVDENCPGAYVDLIGDPPGQKLYRSRGFRESVGIGMCRGSWGM